ncbi:hypothetical protein FD723_41565 (plasmid) [Nostoc sp. C052]|uniref:hypothetical protein n=1 Tax=Nostoc sp. C052 TaxID=2576902 RepID=UPI0015C3FE86|nr:hypothetical protein [Nostoc sp. C052]QLE46678.1 hypothetical protein FD723_41565 [Nostoc sp. C052]
MYLYPRSLPQSSIVLMSNAQCPMTGNCVAERRRLRRVSRRRPKVTSPRFLTPNTLAVTSG